MTACPRHPRRRQRSGARRAADRGRVRRRRAPRHRGQRAAVAAALTELTEGFAGLVVTTGGTGFAPQDQTPEGTRQILESEAPGLAEAMRLISPFGRLSRGVAGIRGQAVVPTRPARRRAASSSSVPSSTCCPMPCACCTPHRPSTERPPWWREPPSGAGRPADSVRRRVAHRPAQGITGAGDARPLRGRRPGGRALVCGRVQGVDRRPAGGRGAHPATAGDPDLRRRGVVRRRDHRTDWIEETSSDVVSLGELRYSKATTNPIRMVVAVAGDSAVQTPADLPDGVRVSSEYPELTRRYFTKLGIEADVRLSYRASEAQVPDIADCVVEITETGRARCGPPACGSSTPSSSATPRSSPTATPTRMPPNGTPWAS